MARSKKSIDELVEESQINLNLHPHSIPDNWIWTKFNKVCDVRDGTHDSPQYVNEGIPLITSKNLKDGLICFNKMNYISNEDHTNISKRSKVDVGDILFAMIGTIGNPVLIENMSVEFSIKNVALFKPYKNIVSSRYINYLLQEHMSMQRLLKQSKGSTQKFIALGKLREHLVPLPPFAEQQRIVNRIDSLFEKIDKAQELIEEAREGFEKRKEAILAKAFSGELTAKWREENRLTIQSWIRCTIGEKIKLVSGQDLSSKFCNDLGLGVPYILGASNLDNNKFTAERWIENPKVLSYQNDVLLSVKGTIGKVYLQNEEMINLSRQIMALRPSMALTSSFLYYFTFYNSKTLSSMGNGLIPGITRDKILNLPIHLPSVIEQELIVSHISKLLIEEETALLLLPNHYEIDLLKKSILAKAFRGELGTNIPEEESANELLKNILSIKVGE